MTVKQNDIIKCHYCKRRIFPGEKTAKVQAQIGNWKGDPHIICRNCAEDLKGVI